MSILLRIKEVIELFIGENDGTTIINDEISEKISANLEEGEDFVVTVAGKSQGFVKKAKVNPKDAVDKVQNAAKGRKGSGKTVTQKTREE